MGSDRIDRMGFTKMFRIPKRMAKIMVDPKESK